VFVCLCERVKFFPAMGFSVPGKGKAGEKKRGVGGERALKLYTRAQVNSNYFWNYRIYYHLQIIRVFTFVWER